jgi:hypothetical protein
METLVAMSTPKFYHPTHNANQVLIERRPFWVKGLSRVSVRAISSWNRVVSPGWYFIFIIEFLTQVSLAVLTAWLTYFEGLIPQA